MRIVIKTTLYHFRIEITYILTGKTVRTQYKIFNKETSRVMPYFIGGHPGFNCPLLDDEVYEDYYLEFEKEETCSVPRPFPEQVCWIFKIEVHG